MPSRYKTFNPRLPRAIEYKGVVYPSINAFYKYARSIGCNVSFGSIRYALDHGRNLEDVLAGKKFEKKQYGKKVVWNGKEYPTTISLYRDLKATHDKVYLCSAGFLAHINKSGIESAVKHLICHEITDCEISKRLGGSNNLVLIRIKNGWPRQRAITEPCKIKKRKKKGLSK